MEREYIVPLRKEFQKVPKHRRTNRAMKALRDFISRHMKSENVSIGKFLNLELWSRGMRNPPHKVEVKATKDSDGKVFVELKKLPIVREKVNKRLARVERSEGKKSEEPKSETKKKDKVDTKSPEKLKPEVKTEAKQSEAKSVEAKSEEKASEEKSD